MCTDVYARRAPCTYMICNYTHYTSYNVLACSLSVFLISNISVSEEKLLNFFLINNLLNTRNINHKMLCYNYYANEQANLKQKQNNLTADHEKKWSSTRKVHITR